MAQMQVQRQRQTVRRMDAVAREQEQAEHAETLTRARRTAKHARRTVALAQTLINEINEVIR